MRLVDLLNPAARAREAQLAHSLRSVPLFKELPAGDLVNIWRHLSQVQIAAGEVVFRRGDPGDRFYVLHSGSLEVSLGLGSDGVHIRRLVPGDSFGELAILTGSPRSADIAAVEDAVLWVLERRDFEALTATSVPLLQALNRGLCSLIDKLTHQVEDLEGSLGTRTRTGVAGMRFGPFRVMEQIGAGGMAVVYSAIHVETEQAVALKVLPAAWGESGDFRQRLEQEASVLGRLDHPGVIRVLDAGQLAAREGGGYWFAMDWLPHALDRVLRAQFPEPLPVASTLSICAKVAEALHAVHDAGVVHRDVKPSNILLRHDGAPVLTDFGLVLIQSDAAAGRRMTMENVIVGTADYMSPEQVSGAPMDGRSDVYSLGVVLYELLCGHVPFAGRDPYEILNAHVAEPPPALPGAVPGRLQEVVMQALRKRPEERFASARSLADALREVQPAPAVATR